jgi:hypothetical protein
MKTGNHNGMRGIAQVHAAGGRIARVMNGKPRAAGAASGRDRETLDQAQNCFGRSG